MHALRHAERSGDRGPDRCAGARVAAWPCSWPADLGPLRRALAAVGADARAADPWLALTAAITHLDGAGAAGRRRRAGRTPDARGPRRRPPISRPCAPAPSSWPRRRACPGRIAPVPQDGEPAASPRWRRCCTPAGGPPSSATRAASTSRWPGAICSRRSSWRARTTSATWRCRASRCWPRWPRVQGDLRDMAGARRAGGGRRDPARAGTRPPGRRARRAARLRRPPGRPSGCRGRRVGRGARRPGSRCRPRRRTLLHAVHGAALADLGRASGGLAEMRGGARGVRGHAGAAVDARRPGPPRAPGRPVQRQPGRRRGGRAVARRPRRHGTGETLLLKAWTEAAAGRHDAAAALVAARCAARTCRPSCRTRWWRRTCWTPRPRCRPTTRRRPGGAGGGARDGGGHRRRPAVRARRAVHAGAADARAAGQRDRAPSPPRWPPRGPPSTRTAPSCSASARMAVLALLPSLLNARGDRRRVHRVGEHGEEPHPVHLRQAGGLVPPRGGSPRARPRPAALSGSSGRVRRAAAATRRVQ